MSIATPENKRRALGKGLDSLLPRMSGNAAPVPAPVHNAPSPESEGGKPREIPIDDIDRNPFQTRTHLNEIELAELAASITSNGVVQPILVRPLASGRFQLIAGERRWRASQLAGKKTIPAILRQVSDEQALEITIVENLQRADLNAMEQARAFERLSREVPHDPGTDRHPHRQRSRLRLELHAPAQHARDRPEARRNWRADLRSR